MHDLMIWIRFGHGFDCAIRFFKQNPRNRRRNKALEVNHARDWLGHRLERNKSLGIGRQLEDWMISSERVFLS